MFIFYEELEGDQKLNLELLSLRKVINVEIKHLKIFQINFLLLPGSFLILNNKI